MKIEGPKSTQQSEKSKKKDKAGKADGAFGALVTGETQESKETSQSQSIAKVDSLLAVQATEDPTERAARKRAQKRADHILDELDKIRMGLLTGTLTVGDVIDVADVVASHRDKVMDPQLTALLDEIDLRAQVEIAKARVAAEKQT